MTQIPVETVKPGMGITVSDPSWGPSTYLIHDVESLFDGEEFRVTYGNDSGRWTDTVSFEAGELVEVTEGEEAPVNLLDAVSAYRSMTAHQATITDMLCAAVYGSTSLDTLRDEPIHQQAAE